MSPSQPLDCARVSNDSASSKSYQQVGCIDSSQRADHLYLDEQHLFLDLPSSVFQDPDARFCLDMPMLSTETIIKLGAQNFISFSSLPRPYPCSTLAHYEEDCKGVQLVENLLYSVKKLVDNQYEHAAKFLKVCDTMSSPTGTPIQRLVFYFSDALLKKIANETGRIMPKDSSETVVDPLELVMIPNTPLHFAFHREYPLSRVLKLVGVQALLEHLKGAKKVHMIDLAIKSGMHWLILMQALASQNEHLKITAVTKTEWKEKVEETGKLLASCAHSLHLKFSFKTVIVNDILELDPAQFDRAGDESVSVYASNVLMSMVGQVDRLDHLMTVMRSLSPCVMIVTEIEVNINFTNFIGRFVESLFYFGALFDSLSDCFKNNETRVSAESMWFRSCIRNVLTTEGEQRKIRHVTMNVWCAFFARLGLVGTDLSASPLEQASMGLQSLPHGSSCTLYMDGKCLILGWKGTPLCSLSAWKFQ